MKLIEVVPKQRLMPIIAADSPEQVVEDAAIYRDAGFNVVEVLCRSICALEALQEARRKLPEMFIGAGTVLTPELAEQALDAGAQFIVSPALDPAVVDFVKHRGVQFIPGIYTPTDVAIALRQGFYLQKLFPAEPAGGVTFITALNGPFGHTPLRLVCGEGIGKHNIADYLRHPLTAAVIPYFLPVLRGDALRKEVAETVKLLF